MPVRILPLNMKESQGKRMATRVIVIEVLSQKCIKGPTFQFCPQKVGPLVASWGTKIIIFVLVRLQNYVRIAGVACRSPHRHSKIT